MDVYSAEYYRNEFSAAIKSVFPVVQRVSFMAASSASVPELQKKMQSKPCYFVEFLCEADLRLGVVRIRGVNQCRRIVFELLRRFLGGSDRRH